MKKNLLLLFVLLNFTLIYSQSENDPFSELDKSKIKTGFLYNKVKLPVSNIQACNGISKIRTINKLEWRDIYSEISRSSLSKELTEYYFLKKSIKQKIRKNIFPIGIINYSYNKFKENAFESNLIEIRNKKVYAKKDDIYNTQHVFAASVIDTKQYTGNNLIFDFSEEYYFSKEKPQYFEIDFNNNSGFQKIYLNEKVNVFYENEGEKIIHLKATYKNGKIYESKFNLKVSNPKMPATNETWTDYTADIEYSGSYAQGEVGVFWGDGNSDFTRPVIIVDGFDPGDTRDISGLWDIANQQNMVENLLGEGYDFVITNFYGGDDYIQRNAMLVVKLIQDINARMDAAGTMKDANQIVIIGPSMGGLITRYAIRYMEQNGIEHNVRNWISFDSPMKGADIPLGLQHWVRFFADEVDVESAQEAKAALSGPAAKQMLIYHYTATSGNTANCNSLYSSFYNELNTMGFPEDTRISSIINGDGYGNGQGFTGGDQIIYYHYRSFLVDLDGNVWAVPDNVNTRIFNGLYDTFLPFDEVNENIYVNNTLPFDGAPGGNRNTLQELDETDPGYGDIIAPWNDHAFIPTISALCIQNTTNPYFNVDANIGSIVTPFDKIYYPSGNQEHVAITPESYNWFFHEVINFAPVFTSTPTTSVDEDAEYSYTLSATDENEWNILSYELIEKPDWLIFNAETGEFTGIPLNEDVGEHNVFVKVTDDLDETTQSFIITVNNTNDAPVITSTPIETATEDTEYSYTITATDEDPTNDVLTFSSVNIPEWLSFDTESGILSGIPPNEHVGEHDITLRVNDGAVDVDQTYTITVENTNDTPTLQNELIDQYAVTNEYFSYTFPENTFFDEDINDELSYSANLTNGNPLPEWLNFSSEARTFSGTPIIADDYEITVIATDNENASVQDNFYLYVSEQISIRNNETEHIKIYPNPASENIYLILPETDTKIEIINIQGQCVNTLFYYKNNYNSTEINISNLTNGFYLIRLTTGNITINKKLIIE